MTKKSKQSKKATKHSKRTNAASQPEDDAETATTFSVAEAPEPTSGIPQAEVAEAHAESQQAELAPAPVTEAPAIQSQQAEPATAPATEPPTASKSTRSETAKANIKAGLKQHALAGRPTKAQLILVFGQKGYAMTWAQRTEKFGITPETFQAALAKGVPVIRLGPGAQPVVERAKETA